MQWQIDSGCLGRMSVHSMLAGRWELPPPCLPTSSAPGPEAAPAAHSAQSRVPGRCSAAQTQWGRTPSACRAAGGPVAGGALVALAVVVAVHMSACWEWHVLVEASAAAASAACLPKTVSSCIQGPLPFRNSACSSRWPSTSRAPPLGGGPPAAGGCCAAVFCSRNALSLLRGRDWGTEWAEQR